MLSVANVVPFTDGQLGEVTVELLLAALLVFVVSDAELDLLILLEMLAAFEVVVAEELPESLVMGVVASVHLLKKSMMSGVALK